MLYSPLFLQCCTRRCRQWHKLCFLLRDSFQPVFQQALKSCTFLFFMLSGLLKPHNHPSLIPLISENQPFPAYSLLSFRECSKQTGRNIVMKNRCKYFDAVFMAFVKQIYVKPDAFFIWHCIITIWIDSCPVDRSS